MTATVAHESEWLDLVGELIRTTRVLLSGSDLRREHRDRLDSLLTRLDRQVDAEDPASSLTARERAVLELLSDGHTAAAIGHRLGISPRTAQQHLQNAYRKLGVGDRLLAVRAYRESSRFGLPKVAQ